MTISNLVCVKIFNTRIEAEIVIGMLGRNGVIATPVADDAGGMYPYPFSPSVKGVMVFVKKSDLNKAKGLLKQ